MSLRLQVLLHGSMVIVVPEADALVYLKVATGALVWLLIVRHGLLHWRRSEHFLFSKSTHTGHVSWRHAQATLSSYGAVSILSCYVTMYQSTQQSSQHSLSHHSSLTRSPGYVKPLIPVHQLSSLDRVSISSTTSLCVLLMTFAVSSYSRQASHVTLTRFLTHFLLHHSVIYCRFCAWYATALSALDCFLSVKRWRSSHPS